MACSISSSTATHKRQLGCHNLRSSIYKLQAVAHAPSQLARLLLDSCSDLEEIDSWEPFNDDVSPWSAATSPLHFDDQFIEDQEQRSTADWFQSVSAALPGCGSHTAPMRQLTAAGCYVLHGPAKVTKLSSGLLKAELLPGAWLDIDDVDTPSTQLSLHMEVASSESSSDELPKVKPADSCKTNAPSSSPLRTFHDHHHLHHLHHHLIEHSTVAGCDTGLPRTWETITACEPTTCLLVGEHMEIQGGFQLNLHHSTSPNNGPGQPITLIVKPDAKPDAKPVAGRSTGHTTSPAPSQRIVAACGVADTVQQQISDNTTCPAEELHTHANAFGHLPLPGSHMNNNGHGDNHTKREEFEAGVVALDKSSCTSSSSSSSSPPSAVASRSCEEGVLHAHGHVLLKVHALPADHSWCLELPQGSVISHPLNVCPDTWHTS